MDYKNNYIIHLVSTNEFIKEDGNCYKENFNDSYLSKLTNLVYIDEYEEGMCKIPVIK